MLIRACVPADLRLLERADPSGLNAWHEQRFRRQLAAESTYLLACDRNGFPVGSGEVRWNGCVNDSVRRAVPDCPEINGLAVYRGELRGQGIGSAIIREAEIRAKQRGYHRTGLGVGDDNPRAARLYERLGYRETIRYIDAWSYVDDDGVKHGVEDPCTFLIKDLRPVR